MAKRDESLQGLLTEVELAVGGRRRTKHKNSEELSPEEDDSDTPSDTFQPRRNRRPHQISGQAMPPVSPGRHVKFGDAIVRESTLNYFRPEAENASSS